MNRIDAPLQAEVDRHLAACAACRASWQRQQRLGEVLAGMRAELASHTPPASVETALRAAFVRRQAQSRRWEKVNLFGLPLAIAATLVAVSWSLRAPMPTVAPERAATTASSPTGGPRGEIGTAFFPLVPLNQIAQNTDTRVVEISLPRTALASFGLPIDPARAAEPVSGEMLVSGSGSPLAVRFIVAASTD